MTAVPRDAKAFVTSCYPGAVCVRSSVGVRWWSVADRGGPTGVTLGYAATAARAWECAAEFILRPARSVVGSSWDRMAPDIVGAIRSMKERILQSCMVPAERLDGRGPGSGCSGRHPTGQWGQPMKHLGRQDKTGTYTRLGIEPEPAWAAAQLIRGLS